jgi:hypothetical protein
MTAAGQPRAHPILRKKRTWCDQILPLIGMSWVIMVKPGAPSQRSNIPQTALVAPLDTYDFMNYEILLSFIFPQDGATLRTLES